MSSEIEHERWKYEQNRSLAEKQHNDEKEFRAEANKSAVNSGAQALKAFILINGGASIAMLAFIGRLASLEGERLNSALHSLSVPLLWFTWGVGSAAFGTGMSYFANYCIAAASTFKGYFYEQPFIRETPASRRWGKAIIFFQVLAIVAGVASLVFFMFGAYAVKNAIAVGV